MQRQAVTGDTPWRKRVVIALLAAGAAAVVWRAMMLHLFPEEISAKLPYRVKQHIGKMLIPARRGEIVDRTGEVLALSTPMVTVGCNPQKFPDSVEKRAALAKLLGKTDRWLKKKLERYEDKRYIPLKKQVEPETKQKIAALKIKGVEFRRGSRRFYPEGEAMASMIGFTNQQDVGQEGVELAYDSWLDGKPEQVRVVRDAVGKSIETLSLIERGEEGKRLHLTLDRRLQFLAYRSLNRALKEFDAESGTVVVLDSDRSEILAMVSLPSFNPNDLAQRKGGALRNRAVTDLLEPGSTMKPFTVAAAMENGIVTTSTTIDTSPGTLRVGRKTIREFRNHNYKEVNMARLLQKSSNVGSAMVALMMKPQQFWRVLDLAGIGEETGSTFPGEGTGVLRDYARWRKVEQATLSYGYGMSMTPLQLARAYTAIAEDGMIRPITFLQSEEAERDQESRRGFSAKTAKDVRLMMEKVTQEGGTARRARVKEYRVAGKTGTVDKLVGGRYADADGKPFGHTALFAGMAPVEDPRVVVVVVVDGPKGKYYTGGAVAAPVFSEVMGGALRVLGIPPEVTDDLKSASHG